MSRLDDWQTQGLCRGNHAHLFFPPPTFERKDDRERREMRAKAICNVCPSLEPCASYAVTINEPYGIWGATSEIDRKAVMAS